MDIQVFYIFQISNCRGDRTIQLIVIEIPTLTFVLKSSNNSKGLIQMFKMNKITNPRWDIAMKKIGSKISLKKIKPSIIKISL